MNHESKTVTKITEPDSSPAFTKPRMTEEQMQQDFNYKMAQKSQVLFCV